MEGSRQVLVKVILLQLRERVHSQDGTTPSFFMNEGALYWCFQLMYHLFKNSFGKVIKTLKIEQVGQYTAMPVRNGTLTK